jgi:radical SAM protein with 4Fe4S-binding SPASM domain
MEGWRALRRHDVDFNILCTVNAANEKHGRAVYRFFRDELGAKWVQFIPIIERATEHTISIANKGWSEQAGKKRLLYTQAGNLVTERTVGAEQYGRFLVDVFEEWVRHDVGQVYVQLFDVTLEAFFGRHLLCIHAPTCGYGPALEHNGDLYSCDHFVEPKFLLGNIHKTHMLTLVASPEQRKFGQDKRDTLTAQCQACKVKHLCNGGCPKDRFALSRDGEPGHNYLCQGLELFFMHTGPRGVLHCWADGKGGQKIENTGPLTKKRMETVDDETTAAALTFIDKAHKDGKPFFVWYNTTAMHFRTHCADKHKGKSGQGDYNDVMVAHDEHIGEMLNKLDQLGIADDTSVMYSTDNGPHYNSWPDAGITPFRSEKNTNWEGGWRVPAFARWQDQGGDCPERHCVPPGLVADAAGRRW